MNIVIFGANGKVGRLIVASALANGHHVTAAVRNKHAFTPSDQLQVAHADVYDAASVASALAGADVVMSALGSWGTDRKNILTTGMEAIIPAMQAQGISRIVTVTGSDAWLPDESRAVVPSALHKFFGIIAPKILIDGEKHLQLLQQSKLQWTTVRSPVMTNLGNPAKFRLSDVIPSPVATIHRQSVASAMLQVAETDTFIGQAPHIHRT